MSYTGGGGILWALVFIGAFFVMLMYMRVTQLYPLGGDDQTNNNYAYYNVTHASFWSTVILQLKNIWSALQLKASRFFPWAATPYWLCERMTENITIYRIYIAAVTCITALALALLLYRMTGSRHFALACFCLAPLMMNLLGAPGRNGLYSYAALPQRALLTFLLAAHAEVSWARKRRWYQALLACVFMFISCGTYEIGYVFGIAGGFLALMLHDKFKDSVRTYVPLICGEVISFIFYILTVQLHGASGSTAINFDISVILSTWVKQMSGGFPLNATLLSGLKAESISFDDLIWPLLLAGTAVACVRYGKIKLTKKQTFCLLGCGAVILAGPAFLLSLTAKYQSSHWVSWTYAYISAAAESFGVCIFFLLLLVALTLLVQRYVHSRVGQNILYVLLCLSIAMGNAWMHSIVRISAPVDAVAGYELYGKALENGLADTVGSGDKIISTYTIWGGDSNAERGMYLRHADKEVDAQTVGTWQYEGSNMPAGTLYLSGLCPGYNWRGAFFLAKVQDKALEHIGPVTLYIDGKTVPDEAYVHYRIELTNSIEDVYTSLSLLPHTERNDDGCYFAYITDTDILSDSLVLQTQKEAIEQVLDGCVATAAEERSTATGNDRLADLILDRRFLWQNNATVVEGRDLAIGNAADGQLVSFPFTIKKNTIYKVEVTLGQETDFADAARSVLIVDFYAGPGYDGGGQEASGFTQDGKYDYTFYFDSGDVGGETLDGSVRMFTGGVPEGPIPVETLRVTEMEHVE